MNKKNHNHTPYKNERGRSSPSSGIGRTPTPSYRRPRSFPSSGNGRIPTPIYKSPKTSHSYRNGHLPTPIYKTQNQKKKAGNSFNGSGSRNRKMKKVSVVAFSLIITSFLLYGGFLFLSDTTAPMIRITSPSGGSRLSSSDVSVSWTGSDAGSGINHYEVQLDSGSWINVGTSKSHSFTRLNIGSHSISVRAYDNYGHDNTKTVSFTVVEVEKIAAFFWATDVSCDQSIVNGYIDILENEGYTKFFCFEDTDDFTTDFQQVADYEESEDIIFFYLFGHGNNNGQHSFTVLNPGDVTLWSNQFRDMCDALDSSLICSLVESCHSGDWADDMSGGGYLAMSTSDEVSLSWMTASGGIFTNTFFDAIESGSDAIDAFSVAEARVQQGTPQNPKLCDESAYDFFAN